MPASKRYPWAHGVIAILFIVAATHWGMLGAAPQTRQQVVVSAEADVSCATPFARPNTKLKDHSLFKYQGYYYLVSIQVVSLGTQAQGERDFAYARTRDFCTWEDLDSVLARGQDGEADESALWAPHVVEDNGMFYMFYTGVNRNIAQSIMLAVSQNPAEPRNWVKQGVVFRPNHSGMVYAGAHKWSDNRDPMVMKQQGQYFLYYTAKDIAGGIVGVATSATITGTWQDWGAVAYASPKSMAESPFVLENGGVYYMMYNDAGGKGPVWRWSVSPLGPWQPDTTESIGWAHDFFRIPGSNVWLASYVLGDGDEIRVTPLSWRNNTYPLRMPLIGSRIYLPTSLNMARNEPPNNVIKLSP